MGGIRVVARIRPQQDPRIEGECIVSSAGADGDGSSSQQPSLVRIPSIKNDNEVYSFQFSGVYDQDSTQQTIFDNEIAPTIKHLFNGYDVTLFAYGVTGTGKTYTMRGGKSLADRGIIPRLLSSTYRRCRKIEKDSAGKTSVGITLSYYEIYNDKVFDLLEAPEKRTLSGLHLRDNGGKTVVVGLTERPCESLKEFEKLYDQANINRSTSATKLNAHSSRSHAILGFKVSVTTGDEVRVSTASGHLSDFTDSCWSIAIDLAGSEDNRRTDNGKDRMVESASINKSLFVLAKCVEAISQKQARVPYRESKMTRILSLGQNNGLTVMILNLAPSRSYHLDTISSLNFANRTKKIEVRDVENEPVSKGCARAVPALTGPSIQRQPLRPLATTVHNTAVARAAAKPGEKPTKAFSVYSDWARNPNASNCTAKEAHNRSSPLKRPSDGGAATFSRPAKRRSPDRPPKSSAGMSKAAIEEMIEKKVGDILAARVMDPSSVPSVPDISEEVRKRLDALEQKIDGQDDGREQGLTFLLMAKQHAVRGEDKSALRMFLLAKEYFPDNAKLATKIEKLQVKLTEQRNKKEGSHESRSEVIDLTHEEEVVRHGAKAAVSHHQKGASKPVGRSGPIDDEYRDESGVASEDDYDSADSFRYRARAKRPNKKAAIISHAQATPRTKQLLYIINSRDVGQIRLLSGVGAKRAEAIVEALCGGEDSDGSGQVVRNLAQLGHLRGVGAKTVEKMRSGLLGT
ncbi:MAG: hypothetical protein Q9183_000067 [Haloplaca sp. 2 TL-2023]